MPSRKFARLSRIALAALLVGAASCSESTAVPATLVATARTEGLVLINRTPIAVNFIAMSETSAPLVDWIQTATPRIAPGESLTVPRSEILGLGDGPDTVVVYWWGVRAAAGGGYEIAPGVGGTLHVGL